MPDAAAQLPNESQVASAQPVIGRRQSAILLPVLVFLVSFIAVFVRPPWPEAFVIDADTGHQLAGAQQISFGEHPFIDFHSTYGPLTFYASYVAQRIGGGTIAAELLLSTLAYAAAYLLIFLAARQLGRTTPALVVTAIAIVQLPRLYKYYIFLGCGLVLVSLYGYIRKPSAFRLFILAVCIAFSGLYRPEQGVYSYLVAGLAVLLVRRDVIRALIVLPAMIVIAASPWLIFLLVRGGLKNYLVESSVGAAAHAAGLSLPFPRPNLAQPLTSVSNLSAAVFLIWWVIPVIAAIVLLFTFRKFDLEKRAMLLVTIVYAVLCLLQSAHRSDPGHLIQAIVPCYVLVAFFARMALLFTSTPRAIGGVFATAGLACAMALSICAEYSGGWLSVPRWSVIHDYTYFYAHRPDIYVARLRATYPTLPSLQLIDFIESHTPPQGRFLAIPYMTMLYYLTQRPFAGGQMMLAPGYFSDAGDQQKMVDTLQSQGDPLIVEVAGGGGYDGLPERRSRAYSPILFQHIDSHYRKVEGPPLPSGFDAMVKR
jgi:hypothetical protein